MTNEEINAYAAGLVDGEGSIFIAKQPSCYTIRIVVEMTERPPIEFLHKNFGGRMTSGKVLKSGKRSYVWCIATRGDIEPFINRVYKYMLAKKEQARIALFFVNTVDATGGEEWHKKMKELNK